jgi:hypothetical protein
LGFHCLLQAFWVDDYLCETDQCRGDTITQALFNQTAIIESTPWTGAAAPRRVAYLWAELLELQQAGTLHFPPNTSGTVQHAPIH